MSIKLFKFQITKQYHSLIYLSAPIAVESFLFITGLLIANNMLKQLGKTYDLQKKRRFYSHFFYFLYFRKGKLNVLRLYLHRFMRLTPLLGFTFLFKMSLLKFLGDGPIWPYQMKRTLSCERYWWSTLLYIQNYTNPKQMVSFIFFLLLWIIVDKFFFASHNQCFSFSWYLCVDM